MLEPNADANCIDQPKAMPTPIVLRLISEPNAVPPKKVANTAIEIGKWHGQAMNENASQSRPRRVLLSAVVWVMRSVSAPSAEILNQSTAKAQRRQMLAAVPTRVPSARPPAMSWGR